MVLLKECVEITDEEVIEDIYSALRYLIVSGEGNMDYRDRLQLICDHYFIR